MKMNSVFLVSIILMLLACNVSKENIPGKYYLKGVKKSKLILKKDHTFEFVKKLSEPGPSFFPDSTDMNFRTTGTWKYDRNGKVILNSTPVRVPFAARTDSVSFNTSITSFSFWDNDGDPVMIRFMKFPPDKMKLYKANTISFFAEDFSMKDTLEFHFYGYAPIKWPSDFKQYGPAGNHSFKITLHEEIRPSAFDNVVLLFKKDRLVSPAQGFAMVRED